MKVHHLSTLSVGVLLAIIVTGGQGAERPSCKPKAVYRTNAHGVNCVAFAPDGKTIAAACESGNVEIWEVGTNRRRATLRGRGGCVAAVAFHSDGRLLASANGDGTIQLWTLPEGRVRTTLQASKRGSACIAFSPDGKLLASGSDDIAIQVWNVRTGCLKATLKGHSKGADTLFWNPITSVAFSSDGKLLASGGMDGTIRLWDMPEGRSKASLLGSSSEGISSVVFSGNGKFLAASCLDGDVKIWNLDSGKVNAVLKGHMWAVSSLAFSPNSKLLASVSGHGVGDEEWEEPPSPDCEIKVWEVASGHVIASLADETGQIWSVAFSPNGKLLATGDWASIAFPKDGPGSVRLWDVQPILSRE